MSHARKHIVQQLADEEFTAMDELSNGSVAVGRVVEMRGSHCLVDVPALGGPVLTLVPAKFRGVVWLKRGSPVALQVGDIPESTKYKLRATLLQPLLESHIAEIKEKGLWPSQFDQDDQEAAASQDGKTKSSSSRYRTEDDADDAFDGGNPNRRRPVYVSSDDSSSSDDDSSSDE